MKLLILLGIIYVGYRASKSWITKNLASGTPLSGQKTGAIDDVMVKDPFCNVYFPKRDGVHLKSRGEDLFFCSTDCRDKYVVSQNNDS